MVQEPQGRAKENGEPRRLLYGAFDQPSGWTEPDVFVCERARQRGQVVVVVVVVVWSGRAACWQLCIFMLKPHVC